MVMVNLPFILQALVMVSIFKNHVECCNIVHEICNYKYSNIDFREQDNKNPLQTKKLMFTFFTQIFDFLSSLLFYQLTLLL